MHPPSGTTMRYCFGRCVKIPDKALKGIKGPLTTLWIVKCVYIYLLLIHIFNRSHRTEAVEGLLFYPLPLL